jgi:hypothetical protein
LRCLFFELGRHAAMIFARANLVNVLHAVH